MCGAASGTEVSDMCIGPNHTEVRRNARRTTHGDDVDMKRWKDAMNDRLVARMVVRKR